MLRARGRAPEGSLKRCGANVSNASSLEHPGSPGETWGEWREDVLIWLPSQGGVGRGSMVGCGVVQRGGDVGARAGDANLGQVVRGWPRAAG